MFVSLLQSYKQKATLATFCHLKVVFFAKFSTKDRSDMLLNICFIFHAVTASESHSEPQSYRKSHEKAPDKTEKVSAEVKV